MWGKSCSRVGNFRNRRAATGVQTKVSEIEKGGELLLIHQFLLVKSLYFTEQDFYPTCSISPWVLRLDRRNCTTYHASYKLINMNFRLCCCFFSAHSASWTSVAAFPWQVSRWQGCPTGGPPPPRSPPRPRGWPSTSCCSPSRPTTAPSPASRAGPRSPTWLEVTPHTAQN